MRDASIWIVGAYAILVALAVRVLWCAGTYYFARHPRYPLETAAIGLVVVGLLTVGLRSGDRRTQHDDGSGISAKWLLFFVVAASCLYAPAFGLGLLSDDYVLRSMVDAGAFAASGWFFRPIPLLVWRLVRLLTGSSVALHAVNVVLHGINAFLVAVLGVRLGMTRWAALAAATLFVSFPAAVEPVAWLSGIQDVLLTTTALGTVVLAAEPHWNPRRWLAIVGLLILALGTKETAVCIPALIAICWISRASLRRFWLLYVVLCAVAVAYSGVRVLTGINPSYLVPSSRYFVKQLIVTAFGTLAAPWPLPATPLMRAVAFTAAFVLTLLVTQAFATWRRPDAAFRRSIRLALWVIAAVGPVFSYFFVSPLLEGSRYVYLAESGWALLVMELVHTATEGLPKRSVVETCVVGVAVVVSSFTLERELGVWRRAADARDLVLTEAQSSIGEAHCAAATFKNVPDSAFGAYVFRNGLPEALGLRPGDPIHPSANCDFTWTGDRFAPSAR